MTSWRRICSSTRTSSSAGSSPRCFTQHSCAGGSRGDSGQLPRQPVGAAPARRPTRRRLRCRRARSSARFPMPTAQTSTRLRFIVQIRSADQPTLSAPAQPRVASARDFRRDDDPAAQLIVEWIRGRRDYERSQRSARLAPSSGALRCRPGARAVAGRRGLRAEPCACRGVGERTVRTRHRRARRGASRPRRRLPARLPGAARRSVSDAGARHAGLLVSDRASRLDARLRRRRRGVSTTSDQRRSARRSGASCRGCSRRRRCRRRTARSRSSAACSASGGMLAVRPTLAARSRFGFELNALAAVARGGRLLMATVGPVVNLFPRSPIVPFFDDRRAGVTSQQPERRHASCSTSGSDRDAHRGRRPARRISLSDHAAARSAQLRVLRSRSLRAQEEFSAGLTVFF